MSDEEIEALCQRLIDVVTRPIPYDAGLLTVGLSIGVALAPLDGSTPDELLHAADIALYRSKQCGRGTYNFYAASMNDRAIAYRGLTGDIRRGLAADEFFLEYQPRFETRHRTMRRVEALIRWNHPKRGRIPPLDFVPIAERSGLIVPMGEWALRRACQDAVQWPGLGISVNVSPVRICSGQFVDRLAEVLAETGISPERLELELTESALMEDVTHAKETLKGLKELGVRLAMDDFGTGYSSLGLLKSFPFDVIKIDRQFVADIEESQGGRSVIQAILALGNALGMSATAEGVENVRQLSMLAEYGCDEVQGFHLSKPISGEDLAKLLSYQDAKATEFTNTILAQSA